jgi:hypothetical protein
LTCKQIQRAIEWAPGIGNVSVIFPNQTSSLISTACATGENTAYGGFFVEFTDNQGDLALMTSEGLSGSKILVTEYRKGTTVR